MPQKEAVSTTEPCSHLKATPLAEHFKFRFTPSPRTIPNHSTCGEPTFGFAHVGLKRTSSSPVVFGNGRTHTGEVDGSGGSRLANYCLRASTSLKKTKTQQRQKPALLSRVEKHFSDIIVNEWVADGGEGWGETLFLPCTPRPQSSSDSLKNRLYSRQGKECTRPGMKIVFKF